MTSHTMKRLTLLLGVSGLLLASGCKSADPGGSSSQQLLSGKNGAPRPVAGDDCYPDEVSKDNVCI